MSFVRGRGGGRGGGVGRGRGRGGGAGFGASQVHQNREREAISVFASQGKADCSMEAWTNLFPLNVKKIDIYIYPVSFEMKDGAPDLQDKLRENASREMLRQIKKEEGNEGLDLALCVYTGSVIITPTPINIDSFSHSFTVRSKRKGHIVTHAYTASISSTKPTCLEVDKHRSEINSIVGKAIQTCYTEKIGQKYVDVKCTKTNSSGTISLFDAVTANAFTTTINGRKTSVLRVDVSVSVASARNCLSIMEEEKKRGYRDFMRAINERFCKKKVCTMTHGRGGIYKVLSVTSRTADEAWGSKDNPAETFVEYFRNRYGISIIPEQILFECRSMTGKKVFIPPEVLYEMSVGEHDRRALPQLCSIYPQDRAARIKSVIQRLKNENGGEAMRILEAYGLTLMGEPCKVTGHVLKSVSVLIPRGQGFKSVNTEGGSQQGFVRDLKDLRHATQQVLSRAVVYDETRRGELLTNQINKYLEGVSSPLILRNVCNINTVKDAGKCANEEAFALAFLRRHDKETYRMLKTTWTNKGILSQVVAKDLGDRDAPIVMAISQQMTAKCGHFNWVVNVNDMCPKLGEKIGKSSGLLIIGADVGREQRLLRNEGTTVLQDAYTVAFVAFHVSGAKWHTYCDHYHVNGRKCTIYSATKDDGSSKSDAGTTPSEALSSKMRDFLQEATRHFEDKGLRVASVLVMRGCASEGELLDAQKNDCDLLEGVLRGNVSWAVVAAQRFQHTRFSTEAPQDEEALCNVQRGFVCEECTDSKFGKAFYLTSAHCTLGHARATLYVVFGQKNFDLRELQSLIYGMCFMFPNKTDALPLPLPLKCASEYGRKFVALPEVRNLHKKLHDTMHYL